MAMSRSARGFLLSAFLFFRDIPQIPQIHLLCVCHAVYALPYASPLLLRRAPKLACTWLRLVHKLLDHACVEVDMVGGVRKLLSEEATPHSTHKRGKRPAKYFSVTSEAIRA